MKQKLNMTQQQFNDCILNATKDNDIKFIKNFINSQYKQFYKSVYLILKNNNIGIIYEEKNTNKKTQEKQQLEKNNEK